MFDPPLSPSRPMRLIASDREWVSPEETALLFSRLILNGLLANTLTPHLAESWGRTAGHYGLIALNDQEQRRFAVRAMADEMMALTAAVDQVVR